MKGQPQRMIDASHIEEQAKKIRDVAQRVIDACQSGQVIEAHSRNKVMGGSLAQDATVLAIMILQHEIEE